MATVPLSGTNIRLLTGVPFNNDYKNTRWFDTQTQQVNYFLGKPTTHTMDDATFLRIDGRHYVRANKAIDDLWATNYMMFKNPANGVWWYAFVTKLEYVQKNVTNVHFQIDVFQSWKFYMNFKPSYVVREHCKLWDSSGFPLVNTVDEGLNYGTEYETVSVQNWTPHGNLLFLVIVCKEAMHFSPSEITPVLNGTPQPLTYYVHPFRISGTTPKLKMGGEDRSLTYVLPTLKGIMSLENSVNNVVSLYVTDYIGRWVNYDGDTVNFDTEAFGIASIADNKSQTINTVYVKGLPQYDSITTNMGDKYFGLDTMKESKLYMYPYTVTILDDFKGNRITLKNEYIKGDTLKLRARGSLGTSNKVAYSVDDYNTESNLDFDDMHTSSLENAIINNSPNDISILSDYLSAYLQGNRNSIENQKSAIMWNGTMGSLTGGMVGLAQSTHFRSGANPFGVAAAGLEVAKGVGDAVIQMQGIQAKIRDIDNTPAQLVKMGGNSAFDYGNGYSGVYIIRKQIKKEYRDILQDFFNMFGYKVNRVKVPNFHTRQNWNYVQTTNCTITGNMNNDDLTELKSVFDSGITLWHTEDVGNYALDNEVI